MTADRLSVVVDRLETLAEDLGSQLDALRELSLHEHVLQPEFLTIADLKKLLRVSDRTLRRLRAQRGFPKPVKGPGRLRWRRADVRQWMNADRSSRSNSTRTHRRSK